MSVRCRIYDAAVCANAITDTFHNSRNMQPSNARRDKPIERVERQNTAFGEVLPQNKPLADRQGRCDSARVEAVTVGVAESFCH